MLMQLVGPTPCMEKPVVAFFENERIGDIVEIVNNVVTKVDVQSP